MSSSPYPLEHPIVSRLGRLAIVGLAFLACSLALAQPQERLLFIEGWLFQRGEPADAGDQLDYMKLREWLLPTGNELLGAGQRLSKRPAGNPGEGISYVRPDFDDRSWRRLSLPHDWAIEGPFRQELAGETGKLPYQGSGWYRKHFVVTEADRGRRVYLDIEGAMAYSTVWLNGRLIGGWPYGYSSYRLELTEHLRIGADNVLSIRLNNLDQSSRWYPGAGLYRNVYLVKTGDLRIRHWGVFVTTPVVEDSRAAVNVDVYLENLSAAKAQLEVLTKVYTLGADGRPEGEPVAVSEPMQVEIDPTKAREAMRSNLVWVAKPRLWSLESRNRYVAETLVSAGGVLVDRSETRFGIRTLRFDAEKGFFLNGKHHRFQGVCLHHDLGALGAAINVRALQRQLEILQSMGCNAIRCSHNPPSPELLELCDSLGMLVMDEAFDAWQRGKKWPGDKKELDPDISYFDYARVFLDWHEKDLRAWMRRDRNHPSVVMWSIGNEVIEQWFSDGWKHGMHLAGLAREEDRTRPLTSAFNGGHCGDSGFQTALDLIGFNYQYKQYKPFHQRHPWIPVYGSETAAMLSTRGEYFFPVDDKPEHGRVDFQVTSYDVTTEWFFNRPNDEFKALDEAPFALGEFVWTGFDYLGEPTPYNGDPSHLLNVSDPVAKARLQKELAELGRIRVPSRSSYFGIIDLAGFPKDRFYLYQARWRPELPMVHILPHWNWPGREGQVTPVRVYSSGDEVELFLNGRSLGRKTLQKGTYRFCWDDTVYEPGELRAVAYKQGKPWAEKRVRTTGPATRLRVEPDRARIRADALDLSFVTVTITDNDGQMVPRSKNALRFEVSGPAEIAGVDNGDPTSFEPFQASTRKAFNGLALVILKAKPGVPGPVTLRVISEGLQSGSCEIKTE